MTKKTDDILMSILDTRGIAGDYEVERFLNPQYNEHLYDPLLMTDMDPAIRRIKAASERGEKVIIYGDYDIDGITASAIMIEGLAHLGITAQSYIPDRFEEGYGINQAALEHLKNDGAQLVISVDCGITSVSEAKWALENNLDLIITDHHAVPETIPEAIAVINPKRKDDKYPFKDLCGAGVAFKLIQALQLKYNMPKLGQEKWLLDLVALGTVCDIVDLVDENRCLVTYGLKVMQKTRRPGLKALADVGGVTISEITSEQLGFVMGPRMNAAGRLKHAAKSLDLVLTTDHDLAYIYANELDKLNLDRRSLQASVAVEAERMGSRLQHCPVLVLAQTGWSHGVVGIVASKLVESFAKPVLVAEIMGEYTKGSARSIAGFNMVEALRSCKDLLIKFGGHYYAAGYTLKTSNIEVLQDRLNQYFNSMFQESDRVNKFLPDVAFNNLQDVSWPLIEAFDRLEPFGAGNQRPVLQLDGVRGLGVKAIGADKTHLKLTISDDKHNEINAIGFGMATKHSNIAAAKSLRLFGTLGRNEWQGRSSLQFILKDAEYE